RRVLAGNVADADTRKFKPRDLVPRDFGRTAPAAGPAVAMVRTDPMHMNAAGAGGGSRFAAESRGRYEVHPTGNAVSLEDEMMKGAAQPMGYQMVTTLYG